MPAHRMALLLVLIVLRSSAGAHQLDEFLQATLVEIEPEQIHLQLHFTPGAEVAEQVGNLIDTDRDGVISGIEGNAYSDLLKLELIAQLDQHSLELKLVSSRFPAPADLRGGWERIELYYAISPGRLASGAHRFVLENRHLPGISAYLVNATKPRSASIQIAAQQRNASQSVTQIEFTVNPQASAVTDAAPLRNDSGSIGAYLLIATLLAAVIMGIALMRRRVR